MTVTHGSQNFWRQEAQKVLPLAIEIRRKIHALPELGLHLPETTKCVREALADLDLDIQSGPSTSGLMVTIKGSQQGATILLRGDMDALPMPEETGLEFASTVPGRMHSCGHDAHTAMLIGATRVLYQNRDRLAGNVKLMFQPGEEGYRGALHMINDGLLDLAPKPQAAFALHVAPSYGSGMIAGRAGAALASADHFELVIKGRGGHASRPFQCIDPVTIAFEIGLAFQTFVTRRVDPFDPVVVTIGKVQGGTANNIIPDTATLIGTLRTMSEHNRAMLHAGLRKLAASIAEGHGGQIEMTWHEGYPVTMNDPKFYGFAREVAIDTFGADGFAVSRDPVLGAEDFSYVLQRMPGAMFWLGVTPAGHDPDHAPSCHSTHMMVDETAMANGIAMHCAIAARYLETGLPV
jgi:hippurate hydrolase